MKRDPELIRSLLLIVEANDVSGIVARKIEIDGRTNQQVMAHLNMLADARYIVGEYSRSSTNNDRIIATEIVFDLTWAGHEYLDLIRDQKIWKKTKALSQKVGATSVEVLKEIAKAVVIEALRKQGLPI